MSLAIGGASANLTDLTFPGVDYDHVTLGVEIELAIFNLSANNRQNYIWYPLIKGALKDIEKRLSQPDKQVVFTVKDDVSIDTDWKGESDPGVSVEIATPILLGDQFEWVIPEMCDAINDLVKKQGALIDLSPESGCGLHVHIGIHERHYTLGELKRIAKAVVIFEDVMDIHHADHRRGSHEYTHSNRGALPLRGLSIAEMVDKLEASTTSNELLGIINDNTGNQGKYFKYNLTATKIFGTVEFRQAEGSIDDTVIVEWIRNVVTFIISAIRTRDDNFRQLAYMADQGYAWDENISAYYGLPPPDEQGLPFPPPNDDDSDEGLEEGDDILPDIEGLNLGSGPESPMRKRDAVKALKGRVSAKIHSHHIRERLSNRIHRKNIRERLSNRIKRTLAKVSKRRAAALAK